MAECDPSPTAKLSAREVAHKAYKREKKKRAKEKKRRREQYQETGSSETSGNVQEVADNNVEQVVQTAEWCRTFSCKKATHRAVDVEAINGLLAKRTKAKAKKKYSVSDEITRRLVELEIVYDDEKKQWHTRALLTDEQKQARKEQAKKRASGKPAAKDGPATKKMKSEGKESSTNKE